MKGIFTDKESAEAIKGAVILFCISALVLYLASYFRLTFGEAILFTIVALVYYKIFFLAIPLMWKESGEKISDLIGLSLWLLIMLMPLIGTFLGWYR